MNMTHVVIVIIVFLTTTASPTAQATNPAVLSTFENFEQAPLTAENVAKAIVRMQIQHPEIVFRQAVLESGSFTSRLCVKNNNIFGMRPPKTRTTYAIGKTKSSYAVFKHWSHSIADYKLWQGSKVIRDYYKFLSKRNYSANVNYVRALKSVKINTDIKLILQGS